MSAPSAVLPSAARRTRRSNSAGSASADVAEGRGVQRPATHEDRRVVEITTLRSPPRRRRRLPVVGGARRRAAPGRPRPGRGGAAARRAASSPSAMSARPARDGQDEADQVDRPHSEVRLAMAEWSPRPPCYAWSLGPACASLRRASARAARRPWRRAVAPGRSRPRTGVERPGGGPIGCATHVRVAFRSLRGHLRPAAQQGHAARVRRRRGPARDPPRPARGRRQLRGRQVDAGPHPRGRGRRPHPRGPQPGPAGHQARQRGAGRGAGRRVRPHPVRLQAARRSCSWPASRARARPPTRPSWPAGSASRAATRCSSAPTSSAPPPSSSSARWASRSASPCSASPATRSRPPGPASPRPGASAATSASSTPPAAWPSTPR